MAEPLTITPFGPASVANNGTALVRAPSNPGTSAFLLQGAHFGVTLGGPIVLALLDGTAGGTLGVVVVGGSPNPGVSIPTALGGDRWEGVQATSTIGVTLKALGGAAGTVSGYIYGREIQRQT